MWGADITPDETPYEAGLGLLRQARQGVHRPRRPRARPRRRGRARKLCCLRAGGPALGGARQRAGARRAARSRGRVTSGGYGYTVERSIAYAHLPPEHADPGTEVAVEIFGDWVGGRGGARAAVRPGGRAGAGVGPTRLEPRKVADRGGNSRINLPLSRSSGSHPPRAAQKRRVDRWRLAGRPWPGSAVAADAGAGRRRRRPTPARAPPPAGAGPTPAAPAGPARSPARRRSRSPSGPRRSTSARAGGSRGRRRTSREKRVGRRHLLAPGSPGRRGRKTGTPVSELPACRRISAFHSPCTGIGSVVR